MTTPLEVAERMAKNDDVRVQAYAVAMIARGLSDEIEPTPEDPVPRAPWSLESSVDAAITRLGLAHTKKLRKLAVEFAPKISDATLNKGASGRA